MKISEILENNPIHSWQDEFEKWFASIDLESLEDVRDYVKMYALQNVDKSDNDPFQSAKNTVQYYLDDIDSANETFGAYR